MAQRVLMIEDVERLAGMVTTYLGQNGYALTLAGTFLVVFLTHRDSMERAS